mmetsp:Transcript_18131/g.36921  ORF Transcript_18131/g.36921 Transcript_18131/m.36921 type:complete len:204 (+) Transcript_18131:107-718(+)
MFASTKRFAAAVALINDTPNDRFPHLLSRVLGQLHAKAERVFSAEEEAALCELFGFSDEQLELLLSSCSFIFEQAAYLATAPVKLGDELLKAGVQEEPATAFGEVWQEEGAKLVERLRERAVLAPTRLSGVDWQLCIGTASSDGLTAQQPHAILQLELNTPTPQDVVGEKRSLQIQVDQPRMQELLGKLDAIQGSFDGLSKTG